MKVVPFHSAVPVLTLRNSAVGLLVIRLEMNTSDCDWLSALHALHLSHSLAKALPIPLSIYPKWLLTEEQKFCYVQHDCCVPLAPMAQPALML